MGSTNARPVTALVTALPRDFVFFPQSNSAHNLLTGTTSLIAFFFLCLPTDRPTDRTPEASQGRQPGVDRRSRMDPGMNENRTHESSVHPYIHTYIAQHPYDAYRALSANLQHLALSLLG